MGGRKSTTSLREAKSAWFEQVKEQNFSTDPDEHIVIQSITDKVVGLSVTGVVI